jgi:hypothetical protein
MATQNSSTHTAPGNAITQLRQQLDTMLADLDDREQAVAHATELLSQDSSVQAAWRQGAAAERSRIVTLIDHQLEQLSRGGTNAVVLTTLRRMVLEVEA